MKNMLINIGADCRSDRSDSNPVSNPDSVPFLKPLPKSSSGSAFKYGYSESSS
jgi:hypothetical protein